MPLPTTTELGLDAAVPTKKGAWARLFEQLMTWFDSLPVDLGPFPNRPIVVNSGGSGLTPAAAGQPTHFGGGTVAGYVRQTVRVTSATLTLDSTQTIVPPGAHIAFERASAQTVTVAADLPVGWEISWSQEGSGQVTFAGAGGVSIRHRLNHTKSAGENAVGGLRVAVNDGSGVEVTLFGDSAA